jgi:transcriptional regulator with XRE-family HTH domain
METLMWSTGLAVHMARRSAGLTQEQLADELAQRTGQVWSQSTVSRLERGERQPTVAVLIALRDLFGFDLAWWVDGPLIRRDSVSANPGQLKPAA